MRLSTRRLSYFLEVASARSVRGAADRLGVDPSVVSRAISTLEEECGSALLKRHGRGVALTEIGELVAKHARQQSAHENALLDGIRSIKTATSGFIELAIGEAYADWLVATGFSDFLRERPGIVVNVSVSTSDEIVRGLTEERTDIGIAYQPRLNDHVRVHRSARTSMAILVRRDHPLAEKTGPLRLENLADHAGILFQDAYGARQRLRFAESSEGIELRSVITVNSYGVAHRFARAGIGYALSALSPPGDQEQEADVVSLPLDSKVLGEGVSCLMSRRDRTLSPAAEALLEHLGRQFGALGPAFDQGLTSGRKSSSMTA